MTHSTPTDPVGLFADHHVVKRLGHWTTQRDIRIRARRSTVVIDLRSPHIEIGDITLRLALGHALVKVLSPNGAVIDQTGIQWSGHGLVKDPQGGVHEPGDRRIVLVGHSSDSEIRVHRSGQAVLSAMASRQFVEEALRAHRAGSSTTIDDPTRGLEPTPNAGDLR